MSTDQKPKSARDPLFYGAAQPEGGQGFAEQLGEALRKNEPRPRALFATAKPETPGGAIILDRTDPHDIAKEFVARKYCGHGHLGLYYKSKTFWKFNGSHYEELEFDVLSAEVYGFINAAKRYVRDNPVPIIVKPDDVGKVMKCIEAGTTIPAKLPQPCWIETEKPAPELFAFKNRLVDIYTGKDFAPTPRLWITDAVTFNYEPSAECPRWEQFLREIHPNDPDAQNCLEEELGYGMTYDASATRLTQTIAAKTNPIAAFMQEFWVIDHKVKPGPLAAEIETSFEMWCEEHRRADLIESYPRNELLKSIREIEAYSWLHAVKPHGETRRYPGIRRRTKEDRKKEEEAELKAQEPELKAPEVEEVVHAPLRRF
jgi:hypothetical protein